MAIPGTAAADNLRDSEPSQESPLEVTTETVTEEGKTITLSVAENTETGEKVAMVAEMDQWETPTDDSRTLETHEGQAIDTHETTSPSFKKSDPDEVKKLINQISDEKEGLETFSHGGWGGVIDDLPTDAEEYVVRAGWFLNEIGSCDSDADSFAVDDHLQFGVTVEWTDFVDDLMSRVVFGSIIGGLLGLGLSGAASGGPGAPFGMLAGGAVGAIASVLWEHYKDSKYLTFVFQDLDICYRGICAPASKFAGSGRYNDQSEHIGAFGYYPVHLEDYDLLGGVVSPDPVSTQYAVYKWVLENFDP